VSDQKTIQVDIVSAEKEIYSGIATILFATALEGEVGIAPNHAPFLSPLKPGEIRIESTDGSEDIFYISGGMIEVQPYSATILADTVIRAADLDEAMAKEAQQKAEKALQSRKSDYDYAMLAGDLARAVAQLRAIKRLQKQLKR